VECSRRSLTLSVVWRVKRRGESKRLFSFAVVRGVLGRFLSCLVYVMNLVVERVAFHDSAQGGERRRSVECFAWFGQGFEC
jgi:hypothetical protein